ncbi:interleukin-22 receptor subunit alpha-2, partial [Plectropomus leopardus]|uniref:interleukin-22 receptor subunit alpha-2 n=1 Tax=Plectropomus leopardus TaxID=160734 RepID=UPI001C4BAE76
YGEPQWLDVDGCQGIQKPQCDLSVVTSETREWYYARVHASSLPSSKSAWALSPRFSPRWDTKISSPILRLNLTEQGIVVRVRPSKLLVRRLHSSLQYKIYLMHASGEE